MNIKSLRAFRATVSEGSLAGAAKIMNLSQPAVSRLISSLEGELKLELFYRTRRSLRPTPAAVAFYREAGRILDNLDEIPRIAADIRAGKTESLRIVANPRIAQSFVSPAVAQFIRHSPDANVSLDIRARRESSKWLAGREYDIGIGALPVDHPDIEVELLLRVRTQAIVSISNPLAVKTEISGDELKDQPVVRLMPGLLLRDQLDDVFKSAGVTPKQVCEVASSQIACALVAEGVGITIADELVASQVPQENIVVIPIKPERWMSFGLLVPKGKKVSPVCENFIQVLREQAQIVSAKSRGIWAK